MYMYITGKNVCQVYKSLNKIMFDVFMSQRRSLDEPPGMDLRLTPPPSPMATECGPTYKKRNSN